MIKPGSPRRFSRSLGVTLIELVITIAIAGILVALLVNFAAPVRSYVDTSKRAALADAADTALRRIGRDLRLALPNSVRVTPSGGVVYLEMLLVRTGGRYRAEADTAVGGTTCGTTAGDVLDIGTSDSCFVTLGDVPNIADVVDNSDYLVVFNMPPGTDKADAYQPALSSPPAATDCGAVCNKSLITGHTTNVGAAAAVQRIAVSANTFTYESPGKRFFIIEGPVTYACTQSSPSGGGVLTRYQGYTIKYDQPTPPTGGSSATLVDKVSSCSFTYNTNVASQGAGLVTLSLQLTTQTSGGANESIMLYHSVHVNNVP